MKAPKVTLSAAEQHLICSKEIILTKNSILEKLNELFGNLGNEFQALSIGLKPKLGKVFKNHPKVSKGEKHEGYPWLILDYPRHFHPSNGHCAIRCFFWWGHFCSIHLQVSGDFLAPVSENIVKWLALQTENWLWGYTFDPWNLALPNLEWKEHYLAFEKNKINEVPYLKIAQRLPLAEITTLETKMPELFRQLILLLQQSFSHQGGETIL